MPFIEKVVILFVFGCIVLVAGVEFCLLGDLVVCRLKSIRRKSRIFSKPAIVVHVIAAVGLLCVCYGFFIEPSPPVPLLSR